jgi:hypothetical protein
VVAIDVVATQLHRDIAVARSAAAKVGALKAKHAAIRQANAALIPVTLERVFGVEHTGARQ